MQSSPNPPKKKKRIPLDVTLTEQAQLQDWARRQGLGVSPAIRALLYREGALQAPDPSKEKA